MINSNFGFNISTLQNKTFLAFHSIPKSSHDRNKAKKYEKLLNKFQEFVSEKSDDIIDVLTDSVKDFLTPNDMVSIKKRFEDIFSNEMREDLRDLIKATENSLSMQVKNSIIKSKIMDIKDEVGKVRDQILSNNWGVSIEEAEKYTILAQVLSLSNLLIQWVIDDMDWESKGAIDDANLIMGMIFYLIIKFIAMIKGKVTLESLTYAVSAVQVALNESKISAFY